MERGLLLFVLVCGCTSAAAPDPSMMQGSGTSGASSSSSTSTTTTSTSTSTSTSGQGESSSTDESGPKLDMPMPAIETCEPAARELVDLQITTPDGPFVATHAWWGWEACCDLDPWLVVSDAAPLEIVDGVVQTPHVFAFIFGLDGHVGPYVGVLPISVGTEHWQETGSFETGFELLAPLDPDAPPDGAQPPMSATFAVEGQDWSIQGSVQAAHCAALDTDPCPCE